MENAAFAPKEQMLRFHNIFSLRGVVNKSLAMYPGVLSSIPGSLGLLDETVAPSSETL